EQTASLDVSRERRVGLVRGCGHVVRRRRVRLLGVDQKQVTHRTISSSFTDRSVAPLTGRRTAAVPIDTSRPRRSPAGGYFGPGRAGALARPSQGRPSWPP